MNTPTPRTTSILGLPKLPARYGRFVLPLLLSIVMSGIVSLISTLRGIGLAPDLLHVWLTAWLMSWSVAFPTLLAVLPLVRRLTAVLVDGA